MPSVWNYGAAQKRILSAKSVSNEDLGIWSLAELNYFIVWV
jgi:hypothetical protein